MILLLHEDMRIPASIENGWFSLKDLKDSVELEVPFLPERGLPDTITKLPPARLTKITLRNMGEVRRAGFIIKTPILLHPSCPMALDNRYLVYHAGAMSGLPFADGLTFYHYYIPPVIKVVSGRRFTWDKGFGLYPSLKIPQKTSVKNVNRFFLYFRRREDVTNAMVKMRRIKFVPVKPFTHFCPTVLDMLSHFLGNIGDYVIVAGFRHLNFRLKAVLVWVSLHVRKRISDMLQILENQLFISMPNRIVYSNLLEGWTMILGFEDNQLSELKELIPPIIEPISITRLSKFMVVKVDRNGMLPVYNGVRLCWVGGTIE